MVDIPVTGPPGSATVGTGSIVRPGSDSPQPTSEIFETPWVGYMIEFPDDEELSLPVLGPDQIGPRVPQPAGACWTSWGNVMKSSEAEAVLEQVMRAA